MKTEKKKTTFSDAVQAVRRMSGEPPTDEKGQTLLVAVVGDDRPASLEEVQRRMPAERRASVVKVTTHRSSPVPHQKDRKPFWWEDNEN